MEKLGGKKSTRKPWYQRWRIQQSQHLSTAWAELRRNISKLEDRATEIIQTEIQSEKSKKNKMSTQELWRISKVQVHVHVSEVPAVRASRAEEIFEGVMNKNFPKLKDSKPDIQECQRTWSRVNIGHYKHPDVRPMRGPSSHQHQRVQRNYFGYKMRQDTKERRLSVLSIIIEEKWTPGRISNPIEHGTVLFSSDIWSLAFGLTGWKDPQTQTTSCPSL